MAAEGVGGKEETGEIGKEETGNGERAEDGQEVGRRKGEGEIGKRGKLGKEMGSPEIVGGALRPDGRRDKSAPKVKMWEMGRRAGR
jgi:hypothetical protein